MPKVLTQVEMLDTLRKHVAEFPSHAAAARSLEITAPYLHDILQGNRKISEKMAQKLGFTLVFTKE